MNLQDIIESLSILKNQTESKIKSLMFLFGGMGLTLLIFFLFLQNPPLAIICLGLNLILFFIIYSKLTKVYKSTFKNTLIPLALKQIGEQITYQEAGVTKEIAEKTGMFGSFSVFNSEDTVKGNLNDVAFTSSDVRLGYMVSTGKTTTYVPICHGQLYIFAFNKQFKTKTIIREKNISKPKGLSKIKLESEVFNKKFTVYSEQELDTFYLLTPHFMEKLLKLEKDHPGDLFIALYNNEVHIGIHNNKDRFKVPLFKPLDESTFKNQLDDLLLIKEIIEELKLNEKIFI